MLLVSPRCTYACCLLLSLSLMRVQPLFRSTSSGIGKVAQRSCCRSLGTTSSRPFWPKPGHSSRDGSCTSTTVSSTRAQTFATESYLANHRFWWRNFELNLDGKDIPTVVADISEAIDTKVFELPTSALGVVIVPEKSLLIPVNDGIVQKQHASVLDRNSTKLIQLMGTAELDRKSNILVCGFSPRAQHTMVAPHEEERPIIVERKEAIDKALLTFTDTSGEELLSEEYAGTSPSRIYRSFICPRPKAKLLLEPVERAANRTATQIELAMRQVRADRASYLRNTDRSAELLDPSQTRTLHPVTLVLDNIRSAFNVGSMFRTAETAGIAEIVTCGITPHPPHPKLRKTAFTSVDVVPTRHFDGTISALESLKKEGYTVVVLETTSRSQHYAKIAYPKKIALVMGNEITGVDTRVIETADIVVEIPTYGIKNSLNVASVAPIVIFEVLRQWTIDEVTQEKKEV